MGRFFESLVGVPVQTGLLRRAWAGGASSRAKKMGGLELGGTEFPSTSKPGLGNWGETGGGPPGRDGGPRKVFPRAFPSPRPGAKGGAVRACLLFWRRADNSLFLLGPGCPGTPQALISITIDGETPRKLEYGGPLEFSHRYIWSANTAALPLLGYLAMWKGRRQVVFRGFPVHGRGPWW